MSQVKTGAFYVILAGVFFATMSAIIKTLSAQLNNEMIVFFRNLFGLIVLLPMFWIGGGIELKTQAWRWHLLRAASGLAAMYCYFYAIAHIPLANAMLLNYTTPLFAPILVYFWFREKTATHFKYAAIVGFIGVALILKPATASDWLSLDAGIGLLSGLLAALALSTVRRMAGSESTLTVVFYFTVISAVMSGVIVIWHWQPLTVTQWFSLFFVGLFATLGQLAMTRGYHLAEVGKIGPFMYSAVVFAFAYGWMFWQELPDIYAVTGIAFVVVGGVMALCEPRRWRRGAMRT